jgi:hypothetical protein
MMARVPPWNVGDQGTRDLTEGVSAEALNVVCAIVPTPIFIGEPISLAPTPLNKCEKRFNQP